MKLSYLFPLFLFASPLRAQREAPYAAVAQANHFDAFSARISERRQVNAGNSDKLIFYADSTTIQVLLNPKGEVIKTTRFYTDVNELPLFVRAKLEERFPGYSVSAVTEEHDESALNFQVNLVNEKGWLQVQTDIYGRISVLKKYSHPGRK